MDNDFQIKLNASVDLTSLDKQLRTFFDSKTYKINVEANMVGTSGGLKTTGVGVGKSSANTDLARITTQYKNFTQALKNAKTQGQLTDQQYQEMTATLQENFSAVQKGTSTIQEWNSSLTDQRNVLSGLKTDYAAHSQDLSNIIGKYLKWYGIATIVSLVISSLKSMVAEVVKLDKAMTELNKVTDVSKERLEQVKKEAFEVAEGLGRTGEEVIKAVTEFARMGYTIEESLKLSEVAVMMTNVAEGISDTGEAAEKIISILKGVGASSDYAMSLLDRLNNVANKNAISFDKLADMLQSSAATMNILGNNLDETIALLTAGFEILQDEKVANGLQTIGLRIAGLNEDLEEEAGLANDVSKALEKFAGISIWDEQTGAIKNTFTILSEVAEKWDEIGKTAGYQESLLNILAGKRQAAVAGSIIKNFDAIKKVMQDLEESAGSARKENEAYLDSIEGRLGQVKNLFQEISDVLIGSELTKEFINLLKVTLDIVKPLAQIVGLIIKISGLEENLHRTSLILQVISGVLNGIVGLVEKIKDFVDTIPWLKSIIEGLQYVLGFGWLEDLLNDSKSLDGVYKDIAETFEQNKKVVSEYESELTKLIKKIKNLISVEDEYNEIESLADKLKLLKKENEQAENQRKLQEKLLSVEKARLELMEARNKKIRVFRAGRGFVYESDESEVQTAQQNLIDSLNELAEYKYELALDRAEAFIEEFSNLAKQDKSLFLAGWEDLFDAYGDLLDTEFSSYLEKAKEYVDEFMKTFEDADKEQEALIAKTAYQNKISELELEREQYIEGSSQYNELSKKIAELQDAYNVKYGSNYTSQLGDTAAVESIEPSIFQKVGASMLPGVTRTADSEGNYGFSVDELWKDLIIPGYGFVKGLKRIFGFAKGTNFAPGGVSLVGEQGPELVDLPMGARVHTASETRSILSGLQNSSMGSETVFNVGTVEILEPNNFDGFVSQFCTKLNVPNPVKLST